MERWDLQPLGASRVETAHDEGRSAKKAAHKPELIRPSETCFEIRATALGQLIYSFVV